MTGWSSLPDEQRDIASRLCTTRQHDALRCYLNADGKRLTAARTLGIDRKTLDGHVTAAMRRIATDPDFDPQAWIAAASPDR